MTYEIFLMRVMNRTGIDDSTVAQKIVDHAVDGLASCLSEETIEKLSGLPKPLASRMKDHAGLSACDLDEIYRRVSEEAAVDLSFGLEFSQVVFQVIGESVGPAGREVLKNTLDESWQELFEPRQQITGPQGRQHSQGRTLAEDRPGSSRPLSEAKPGHRDSIAHTDEPKSGTDMATSHGKPERRTLASGKPGSSRPISDA